MVLLMVVWFLILFMATFRAVAGMMAAGAFVARRAIAALVAAATLAIPVVAVIVIAVSANVDAAVTMG